MPYRISLTERNAGTDGLTSLFNKGALPSNAKTVIYSNATSQPATPETAVPGGSVILTELSFSSSAFFASVGGTGVASGLPIAGPVLNSGTAAWFRFYNGAASPAALGDGSITTVASGTGDMLFDSITFVSGGIARITSLSLTIPM